LAPPDFFLFPKLKAELLGHHFRSDEDVIHAVEAYMQEQDASLLQEGNIIEFKVKGDYVEK
jgi:hypothetical protein